MRDPSTLNYLLLALGIFLLFGGPALFFGKNKRKDDNDKGDRK